MINLRRAAERGSSRTSWLDSRHTFSFADYHDSRHMGFRKLRVINDDRVQAGQGFGTHAHRDMEILSYVLEGALEHEDSLGTGSVIRPGDVQRMSAGSGIRHSEWNHSAEEAVHFLQIWIVPERAGLPPGYEQKSLADEELRDRLRLIASSDGREGSVIVHQDVGLYAARLSPKSEVRHELPGGRHGWLQVARGAIDLDGTLLEEGDGAALEDERSLRIAAKSEAEILLFDLA